MTDEELHQYCNELESENERLRDKIKSIEQENEGEIRVKIAEEVEEKMMYMGTCLNERDIILDIILGKRIPRDLHCNTDCKDDECKLYRNLETNN